MTETLSLDELLARARARLDRVPPAKLADEIAAGALVIDTRPVEQRIRDGALPDAVVVDRNVLEWRLDPASPHRIAEVTGYDQRIVVVCNEGYSSSLAAATLQELGMRRATDLEGGYAAWLSWHHGQHWSDVYQHRASDEVSWFQREPAMSLELLRALGVGADDAVIDVGGGASTLVDALLARGFRDVTVLDVAPEALLVSRARLGADVPVTWLAADLLTWEPPRQYGVWHDRALLHFQTSDADRARYCAALLAATHPGSAILIGTFADDGPEFCSGLPVVRYPAEELLATLPSMTDVVVRREEHRTPAGIVQPFTWIAGRRAG